VFFYLNGALEVTSCVVYLSCVYVWCVSVQLLREISYFFFTLSGAISCLISHLHYPTPYAALLDSVDKTFLTAYLPDFLLAFLFISDFEMVHCTAHVLNTYRNKSEYVA
jgi:hypothetical protein